MPYGLTLSDHARPLIYICTYSNSRGVFMNMVLLYKFAPIDSMIGTRSWLSFLRSESTRINSDNSRSAEIRYHGGKDNLVGLFVNNLVAPYPSFNSYKRRHKEIWYEQYENTAKFEDDT